MKIWEWNEEFKRFSGTHFKNKDITKVLNPECAKLVVDYFQFATRRKCGGRVYLVDSLVYEDGADDTWVYDGARLDGTSIIHYVKNEVTGEVKEFDLSGAGRTIDIERSQFEIPKLDAFIEKYLLPDLEYKIFIKATGKTDEYTNRAYSDIWDILSTLRGRLDEAFSEFAPVVAEFIRLNFPFTNDIENKVDSIRVKYFLPLKNGEKITTTLSGLADENGIDSEGLKFVFENSGEIAYIKYAKLYIEEMLNHKVGDRESSKINFVIKQAMRLDNLSKGVSKKAIRHILKNSSMPILMVGDRLATKREREKLYAGTHILMTDIVDKEAQMSLLCLYWSLTGMDKYYLKLGNGDKKTPISVYDSSVDKVENTTRKLYYSLNWAEQTDFKMLKKKIDCWKEADYLDTATDEITNAKTVEEMIVDIYNYTGDKKKTAVITDANAVINRVHIDDIHKDLRMFNSILLAYELIKDRPEITGKMSAVDKAIYLTRNITRNRLKVKKYEFHLSICETVSRTGRASVKQQKFINELFEYWKQFDNNIAVKASEVSQGKVTVQTEQENTDNLLLDENSLLSIYNELGGGMLNEGFAWHKSEGQSSSILR